MTDLKQRILTRVADDLAAIEETLRENLTPHLDLVREIAGHILFSGGKRLRPLLTILAARACGHPGNGVRPVSVIFEYLHAATLLHDDLVDGASLRRGKTAAHAVFGPAEAVLTGDFLLARSLSLAAATDRPRVIQVIAEITEHMSQGEIDQLRRKGSLDLTEEDYLFVIERKTAVLLRGACRVGAMVADAPLPVEAAFTEYGYHLGMAFQMADDLLDYTADTAELGKMTGADLREGKLTLPVIHALAKADPRDRSRMAGIIQNPDFSDKDFRELLALLANYGGIAYTQDRARDHVAAAKSALSLLPGSGTRDLLEDIAAYALFRKS